MSISVIPAAYSLCTSTDTTSIIDDAMVDIPWPLGLPGCDQICKFQGSGTPVFSPGEWILSAA